MVEYAVASSSCIHSSIDPVGPGYLNFKRPVRPFLMARAIFVFVVIMVVVVAVAEVEKTTVPFLVARAIFIVIMVAEAENAAVYSFIHDFVNLNCDSSESSL